jgi:hypothetical protein
MNIVRLLIFVACTALCLHLPSAEAASCKKGAGPLYKEKDLKKLKNQIQTAISKKDRAQLVTYASCDFFVGVPDTDFGGYRQPSEVMGDILKLLKDVKWKNEDTDYGSQLHVESVAKNPRQLVFRKDEDMRWYWIGFLVADEKEFQMFKKGIYRLGEDAAHGSEKE